MTDFEDEHAAYAASRSSSYVYVPPNVDDSALSNYADTLDVLQPLPLVILGERGSGKSSLLSTWLQKREAKKAREEFLFMHFAGCSPRSGQLQNMLNRLVTALKSHFQLREMEVPKSEEGLRWSLGRFLAASAAKCRRGRIVIVIDGADVIQGEGVQRGMLHWLPTDLPSCVRFILSTAEFDKGSSSSNGGKGGFRRLHRTFTELSRRKCPVLRLESLGVEVRHGIINEFQSKFQQSFELNDKQAFKIVTARPSSEPLFLRTVLYALSLGVEMSDATIDEQLDYYLAADSPDALISQILDQCASYIEKIHATTQSKSILGATLSVLYVSRSGLTDEEIWGSVQQLLGTELNGEQKECIRRILKDFTMMVQGCRMFTHSAVEDIVYQKYISSPENNIKLHQMMGRYFSKMDPTERQLSCLVWHLEVSGSWNKLKSVLVDIENFKIWWTEENKQEYMNLWASLTNFAQRGREPVKSLVTGQFREKRMRYNQVPRPYCDIVEEFTKSIDVYKNKIDNEFAKKSFDEIAEMKAVRKKEDEVVCEAILKVGEFFLEFAMQGHEKNADCPNFVHPEIPSDDMKTMGVPYLDVERERDGTPVENGLSVYVIPQTETQSGDDVLPTNTEENVPLAANEDTPVCSTYFFRRWMWIQFPLIALSNCGDKYSRGIARKEQIDNAFSNTTAVGKNNKGGKKKGLLSNGDADSPKKSKKLDKSSKNKTMPDAASSASETNLMDGTQLRKTKTNTVAFARRGKRSRTVPKVPKKIADTTSAKDEILGLAAREEAKVMNEISELREEFDNLVQQRGMLELAKEKVDTTYTEVKNMEFEATDNEEKCALFTSEIAEVEAKFEREKLLKSNFRIILKMCARHPAHAQALIDELEGKLTADTALINQIRGLLREETYENVANANHYREMKKLVLKSMNLHHQMITNRHEQRANLDKAANSEASRPRALTAATSGTMGGGRFGLSSGGSEMITNKMGNLTTGGNESDGMEEGVDLAMAKKYLTIQEVIESRTGISDMEVFVSKFLNQGEMSHQMSELKRASERNINSLKKDLKVAEGELKAALDNMGGAAVVKEEKDRSKTLTTKLAKLKREKEKSESIENLYRDVRSGLETIALIIGIPHPHPEISVHEIVNQIESVMEILIEEKDKNQQRNLAAEISRSPGGGDKRKFSIAGQDLLQTRLPELEAALKAYNNSKNTIASRLVKGPENISSVKPKVEQDGGKRELDHEQKNLKDGRKLTKSSSTKTLRAHQRRMQRMGVPPGM